MSRIALDRWEAAQTAEFGHHQDLRLEAYITGYECNWQIPWYRLQRRL